MNIVFILFLLFFIPFTHATTINLVPLSGSENPNSFFNVHARDNCMKALCDLRDALDKLGYEFKVVSIEQACNELVQTIVFDTIPYDSEFNHDVAKWILFLWEPPTVLSHTYYRILHQAFSRVFTMFDELVDGKKYRKFYYPQPVLSMIEDRVPFAQKKLCTLISCNKNSLHPLELYSQRLGAINYFEQNASKDFDFYGVGWDARFFSTYKGLVDHKVPYLKQYKFSICYENMRNNGGYITEKIFDSFVAGCVPVYLGAANIAAYIPSNCYIARETFATLDELYYFLKTMPEEQYNEYLQNICNFFASDAALVFSIEYFIDTVVESIIPGYDKTLIFAFEQIEKIERVKKWLK